MLALLGLDTLLSNPKSWIGLLLLFAVIVVLRTVADLEAKITLMKKEQAHTVTNSFLSAYSTKNDQNLLARVRDAVERANAKTGGGSNAHRQLVRELDAEIDSLTGSFGAKPAANADDEDYDDGQATYGDDEPAAAGDDNDLPDFGSAVPPSKPRPHIRGRAAEFEIYN
jgi:hypothetical protein